MFYLQVLAEERGEVDHVAECAAHVLVVHPRQVSGQLQVPNAPPAGRRVLAAAAAVVERVDGVDGLELREQLHFSRVEQKLDAAPVAQERALGDLSLVLEVPGVLAGRSFESFEALHVAREHLRGGTCFNPSHKETAKSVETTTRETVRDKGHENDTN
jgi:hypothetical protein